MSTEETGAAKAWQEWANALAELRSRAPEGYMDRAILGMPLRAVALAALADLDRAIAEADGVAQWYRRNRPSCSADSAIRTAFEGAARNVDRPRIDGRTR